MCLLTETRALSAQGEKRALVGNLTMPFRVHASSKISRQDFSLPGKGESDAFKPLSCGPVWCDGEGG